MNAAHLRHLPGSRRDVSAELELGAEISPRRHVCSGTPRRAARPSPTPEGERETGGGKPRLTSGSGSGFRSGSIVPVSHPVETHTAAGAGGGGASGAATPPPPHGDPAKKKHNISPPVCWSVTVRREDVRRVNVSPTCMTLVQNSHDAVRGGSEVWFGHRVIRVRCRATLENLQ